MLYRIIALGDLRLALISILLCIPSTLIALTFHEVAHGFTAYKLGDPTAKAMGRLSLNPLKHLDPVGSVLMLLVGYGWAKPVPVNTRYFKNPRKGMALTAIAGPLTNIALSFLGLFVYALIFKFAPTDNMLAFAAGLFFEYFFFLNLSLAVFNMLPVPPFDGSRVLFAFLPDKIYFGMMKYERIIMLAVLAGFWFGLFDVILVPIESFLMNGMLWIINLIL